MKILVASDIHGKKGIINKIISKNKPDYLFFLGDGISIFNDETIKFDQERIFKVKGNCDLLTKAPTVKTLELEGFKFLLTHGHGLHVKNGLNDLFDYAKRENAEVVCFGHTHKSFNESINNIKFFNPGTVGSDRASENSYGIIEISDKKITQKIEKI